jgi:hypothetical protein
MSKPIKSCGFTDVRKRSDSRYECSVCGKVMSEDWETCLTKRELSSIPLSLKLQQMLVAKR